MKVKDTQRTDGHLCGQTYGSPLPILSYPTDLRVPKFLKDRMNPQNTKDS